MLISDSSTTEIHRLITQVREERVGAPFEKWVGAGQSETTEQMLIGEALYRSLSPPLHFLQCLFAHHCRAMNQTSTCTKTSGNSRVDADGGMDGRAREKFGASASRPSASGD